MTIKGCVHFSEHGTLLSSVSIVMPDPGPLVDISDGAFHSHLKPSFFQSISPHSHLLLVQPDLLEFDHSVFDSHWRW